MSSRLEIFTIASVFFIFVFANAYASEDIIEIPPHMILSTLGKEDKLEISDAIKYADLIFEGECINRKDRYYYRESTKYNGPQLSLSVGSEMYIFDRVVITMFGSKICDVKDLNDIVIVFQHTKYENISIRLEINVKAQLIYRVRKNLVPAIDQFFAVRKEE